MAKNPLQISPLFIHSTFIEPFAKAPPPPRIFSISVLLFKLLGQKGNNCNSFPLCRVYSLYIYVRYEHWVNFDLGTYWKAFVFTNQWPIFRILPKTLTLCRVFQHHPGPVQLIYPLTHTHKKTKLAPDISEA
jgi:hypothetical protein